MTEANSTARFVIIHMLQYEVLVVFMISALLLWVLSLRLAPYSTKTREAALARYAALACLGVLAVIAVLTRIMR